MAKRGRKPKEKKGYFYEKEEQAIVRYINSTDEEERNQIFNSILFPALTKMIESIIRRYKLFVPDEEFELNFNDTISYLLTKIKHYKPIINEYEEIEKDNVKKRTKFEIWDDDELNEKKRSATDEDPEFVKVFESNEDDEEEPLITRYFKKVKKKYKAYSYCGTICRNYLMYKCSQYSKKRKRNTSYDVMFEELNNSEKYSIDENEHKGLPEKLVRDVANSIDNMVKNSDEFRLNEKEIVVGVALVNLFRNWEKVLPSGSNKLLKSTILYFLREETMMTTKEIRENMKPYFKLYAGLKKKEIEA